MSNKKKKVTYKHDKIIIDHESGEIKSEEKLTKAYIETEPDFVKLYISDIMRLNEIPPAADKVLMEILKCMKYGNIFPAYAPFKKVMCQNLNIPLNTLNKCIDTLYKKGVLLRAGRGTYLVDPNLFAKGTWQDIKQLRLTIDYNPETGERKLTSNAPEQLKQLSIGFD